MAVNYCSTTLLLLYCSHLFCVSTNKCVRIDNDLTILLAVMLMIVAVHRFKI
jgi:hypothetical protein